MTEPMIDQKAQDDYLAKLQKFAPVLERLTQLKGEGDPVVIMAINKVTTYVCDMIHVAEAEFDPHLALMIGQFLVAGCGAHSEAWAAYVREGAPPLVAEQRKHFAEAAEAKDAPDASPSD